MPTLLSIKQNLTQYSNPSKIEAVSRFFKTAPGQYGAGDQFIGVTVPNQRKVARRYYREIPLDEVAQLLREPVHEFRLTALFILVYKYEKLRDEGDKQDIVKLYIDNIEWVNNWDLVDSSADKILGAYLFDKEKALLYELAASNDLWRQRIAIISTFYFIRNQRFDDTLRIAKLLLDHKHDLIHKAVGWMLREIGNRDFAVEYDFLQAHYRQMPRTMLRYAIEKFDEEMRQKFLRGLV